MFNLNDFTNVLNETTSLVQKMKNSSDEEAEEIQFRIDSNIQALQLMGIKIEDEEVKQKAQALIQSLCTTVSFGTEKNITNIRKTKDHERSDLIEKELLKNTSELKSMAEKFKESLKLDQQVLQKTKSKMISNAEESNLNTKHWKLKQKESKVVHIYFLLLSYSFLCIFL